MFNFKCMSFSMETYLDTSLSLESEQSWTKRERSNFSRCSGFEHQINYTNLWVLHNIKITLFTFLFWWIVKMSTMPIIHKSVSPCIAAKLAHLTTPGMWVTIHEKKRGKEKTGQEKKRKRYISIYFCTQKVKKKRGKSKPKQRKSAEKRKSHMPATHTVYGHTMGNTLWNCVLVVPNIPNLYLLDSFTP